MFIHLSTTGQFDNATNLLRQKVALRIIFYFFIFRNELCNVFAADWEYQLEQAFTLIKAPLGGTLALDQCEGDVDGGDDDDDVDVDDVDILIAGGKQQSFYQKLH